jgi:hypothetical protein
MVITISLAASTLDKGQAITWETAATSNLGFCVAMSLFNFVMLISYVFHLKDLDSVLGLLYKRFCGKKTSDKLMPGDDVKASIPDERLKNLDTPQSILMMITHSLGLFLFSIPTWTETLSKSIHTIMLVKIVVNLLSLNWRRVLVHLKVMDPLSPTHMCGRLTRITLITLAQSFGPAVEQWSKQLKWSHKKGNSWNPSFFHNEFYLVNFTLVLDLLSVFCLWCLFQSGYKLAVSQRHKEHGYKHIVIHGVSTSCITLINAVSQQTYRFGLCQRQLDIKGSSCFMGDGTPYRFDMTNSLQLLEWATCGLLLCGALSYYLMLDDFKTMHERHPRNLVEQKCARDLSSTMIALYTIGAVFTAIPWPYCLWKSGALPHSVIVGANGTIGQGNALGYGDDEKAPGFVRMELMYITLKLIPLVLLIFERVFFGEFLKRVKKAVADAKRAEETGAELEVPTHTPSIAMGSMRNLAGLARKQEQKQEDERTPAPGSSEDDFASSKLSGSV